jgi:CelD/BcsL family acetyltransferase involved in cellulose biosynthesis
MHKKAGWTFESMDEHLLFATRDLGELKIRHEAHMISMQRMAIDQVAWDELDRFPDRTIFQTLPWINFVAQTQAAEPLIAAVKENSNTIGYFTGLIIKKFGFRILGSPFPGWTTPYQGFNLLPEYSRRRVLGMLPSFVFDELKCHHLELSDPYVSEDEYKGLPFSVTLNPGFWIDLTLAEDKLFTNMKRKSCRGNIRKAEKLGIIIEEASDPEFAEDYFAQLGDVFAKQSLIPTYKIERVRALIRNLYPTGNLLLLRARNPQGVCIATGIFPACNDTMYFWGAASWRQYQPLRPNELLVWHAMKSWKSRGIKKFNMGGGGEYKRKYGPYVITIPHLTKSRFDFLFSLRNMARKAWRLRWELLGKINKEKN